MTADLTVLTCTIPGREDYLARCVDSVRRQTVGVRSHLISSDDGTLGPEPKYNALARAVDSGWLAILDDDNYWLDKHVETIDSHFSGAETNCVDQSSAISADAFRLVGGYRTDTDGRPMDQDLWLRIARAGGRFLLVPEVTWFYSLRNTTSA